ncbi:hypothetical protein HDF16_000394 [Granulicella aggregans]|uniref:Membrane protein 6-pyruvoyl-tetrahydropterin synthase-related domain-containing protein n=1 Tax=Granulicella aggregans TaxID=474949 RepID=A0A7W7Z9H8_9BACT|nr:hypothetical protein [Granulicella aggregans]MBB5055725.1 hypothetical protein [Granulicella aggregans]
MRRGPIPLVFYLIPTAAFLAVLPLILHGCSCGHDFDFHLVSWMEAASQFKRGNLHPSWAFSPAWNAGEPRFVFYPPISWSLGAILGLMRWSTAPINYTWIALTASGFAMYSLARTLKVSEHAALIASLVYLANPYMLFTAYERTAYAELLAAAWIPLLLSAILRDRITPLRIAVPVALLWLTNAPAAVMGCYALAVLAVLRMLWQWLDDRSDSRLKATSALALRIFAGLALGLGLAAFYILPAADERRWVQIAMATIEGMRIEDNFLFHHTTDALHDEVLHTASLIAVAILAAALVILATLLVRPTRANASPDTRRHAISLSILGILIGVLLIPASAIFWRIAPEMTFLQFPWRLTAVLAAILCSGLALLLARVSVQSLWLGIFAVIVLPCVMWPAAKAFTQSCDDEDNVAARLAVFRTHMGTDPTDEYTPTNADNEALSHVNPPYWLTEDGNGLPSARGEREGTSPMNFAITTPRDAVVVLNLRVFPAWLIRINGNVSTQRVDRADGLIAVPIKAGRSDIAISYAMTLDRKLGDGITLVALCAAIAIAARRRRISASEPSP